MSICRNPPATALGAALSVAVSALATPASACAIDPAFGSGGRVAAQMSTVEGNIRLRGSEMVIDAAGRLLIAGSTASQNLAPPDPTSSLVVMRLSAAGVADTTFGDQGFARAQFPGSNAIGAAARGLALQANGRVVLAGFVCSPVVGPACVRAVVIRFMSDGSLDPSFGVAGVKVLNLRTDDMIESEFALKVAVDSQQRIVVAGFANGGGGYRVARLLPDGAYDPDFDGDGRQVISPGASASVSAVPSGLAVDAADRVLLAGGVSSPSGSAFLVARLNASGVLDNQFGVAGLRTIDFPTATSTSSAIPYSILLRQSDSVLVAGAVSYAFPSEAPSAIAIAQLDSSGAIDPAFGIAGRTVIEAPGPGNYAEAFAAAESSNQQLFVAGQMQMSLPASGSGADFVVARLTSGGTLDTTFCNDGLATVAFDQVAGGSDVAFGIAMQGTRITLAGTASVVSGPSSGFPLAGYLAATRLDSDLLMVDGFE